MKSSLGISNFLEEISSLSHSVVFIYLFALITEEGFLISLCYFLALCIQMGISFLFSSAFCLSFLILLFPLFLCIDHWGRFSYLSLLFFGTLHSNGNIFPFLQIANIHWIIKKAREFQKNIYFCFIDYAKDFDSVDHNKLWKEEKWKAKEKRKDIPIWMQSSKE